MGFVCYLRPLDDAEIDALLANPGLFYDWQEAEESPQDQIDLDKTWHGVHFLLCGSAVEGEPPLNFLLYGGQPIIPTRGWRRWLRRLFGLPAEDLDMPHVLRPAEVRAVSRALSAVSREDLRARFDSKKMLAAKLYFEWGYEEHLPWLLDMCDELRSFMEDTSRQGKGLLIYFG